MHLTDNKNTTLFILNLGSGKKNAHKLHKELVERQLNVYVSKSKEAFASFIKTERQSYKTLVLCGGDGTINSIISETHNMDFNYAIYPLGSGNGLARELGFSTNLDKLLQAIAQGQTQAVDLLKIDKHYSVNMSGIGFDGYVAHRFDRTTKRGFQSYITETISALRQYKAVNAKITTEKETISDNFFMINIANTRQFGNNAYIAPGAQFNDGIIELALIKTIPWYALPIFLYRLFSCGLKNNKHMQYTQAKHIEIKTDASYYHIDGEAYPCPTHLRVEVEKQLNFIKLSTS